LINANKLRLFYKHLMLKFNAKVIINYKCKNKFNNLKSNLF